MAEKQRQIDMLKGRRPKRRPILPIIASGLAVCERRAAEEVSPSHQSYEITLSCYCCLCANQHAED